MRRDYTEHDDEELRRDEVVRRFVQATDPLHARAIRPPRLSIEEMGREVQRRHAARWRRRRLLRWAAPAVGGLATLALLSGGYGYLSDLGRWPATGQRAAGQQAGTDPTFGPEGRTGPGGTPAPLARPSASGPTTTGVSAYEELSALADRVAGLREPARTGRYTYVWLQSWSTDTTGGAGGATAAFDEKLWRAPDGSGRRTTVTLPVEAPPTGSTPGGGATTVETYRPGGLAVVVERPSADPDTLAGQLNRHTPFTNGPHAPLRAVADMYRYHSLAPDQRAAALRVLATSAGLVSAGPTRDRAGRGGLAVTVGSDGGDTRDVAIFDPVNGTLLSYERVSQLAPPRTANRRSVLVSSVLYLAHDRSDELPSGGADGLS